MQDFENAGGLPPVGANVPVAATEAGHKVAEDDRVDWDKIQSDGAESSQEEEEVPPLGNPEANSSSHAVADDIVHLDDEDDDDNDDDAPLRVRRRNPTRQTSRPS
jgi:hypothetical protein